MKMLVIKVLEEARNVAQWQSIFFACVSLGLIPELQNK